MGQKSGLPGNDPSRGPLLWGHQQNSDQAQSPQGSPRVHWGPARSWAEPSVQKQAAGASQPRGYLEASVYLGLCGHPSPVLSVFLKGMSETTGPASFFSFKFSKNRKLRITIKITLILTSAPQVLLRDAVLVPERVSGAGWPWCGSVLPGGLPGGAVDRASSEGRQVTVDRRGLVPGSC